MSTSVPPSSMLVLPSYTPLQAEFVDAMRNMAAAPVGTVTEQGEYFLTALAERRAVSALQDGDYILVPLVALAEGEVANPTFMATAPIVFLKLVGTPHAVMTYSVCAAFYGPVTIAPFALGDRVKLPSVTTYYVARQGVVEALAELMLLSTSSVTQSSKRPCVRLLGELGEQPDFTAEKGTLKFVNDLDGGRYHTRNKTDLGTREEELHFLFRALDVDRREGAMGVDYVLQTEKYRALIVSEAKSRAELRNPAYTSCGLYDRVYKLRLFTDPVKLKLFLTGNVLTEEIPTLTLVDFMGSQPLVEGEFICPKQNAPLVATLQNLQIVLQVLLSNEFEDSIEPFISHLQGKLRPLELVKSNLLRFTVEAVLRNFFNVVSTVRMGKLPVVAAVKTSAECAAYLRSLFSDLKETLSDHQSRGIEESYFHRALGLNITSASEASNESKPDSQTKKKVSGRPCSGFIGEQLKAKLADGSLYKCVYGADCTFRHATIKEKRTKRCPSYCLSCQAQHKPTSRRY
jgi:hypothetical protein